MGRATWNRRIGGMLVAALTVALAVVVAAPPSLADRDPQPECSLGSGLVIATNSVVYSDRGSALAMAGPFAANVTAGTYTISMTSYDNHGEKPDQNQTREQWYLEGRHQGQVVVTLPTTPDVPENVDYQTYHHPTPVELPDIDQVLVRHSAFPDRSSPNSVVAVCAAITSVGDGDSTSTTKPSEGTTTTQISDQTSTTAPSHGAPTTTSQVSGQTPTTKPSEGTATTQLKSGTTTTTPTDVPPTVSPIQVTSTTAEQLPRTGSPLASAALVAALLIIAGAGLAMGARARSRI